MLQTGYAELGPVESVHYVERPKSVVKYAFVAAIGIVAMVGLAYLGIPACSGVVLVILVADAVHLLRSRRNALRVHEKGLSYSGLFGDKICRWEEVEEFGHILDDGTIPKNDPRYIRKARGFSVWVLKRNGERIDIRPDLTGIFDAVRSIATHVFGPEHVAAYPEDYGFGTIKTTRTVNEFETIEEE